MSINPVSKDKDNTATLNPERKSKNFLSRAISFTGRKSLPSLHLPSTAKSPPSTSSKSGKGHQVRQVNFDVQETIKETLLTYADETNVLENKLFTRLESFIKQRASERKHNTQKTITKFIKEEALATTDVPSKILSAHEQNPECDWFIPFLTISDPELFLQQMNQLDGCQYDAFLIAIGGKKKLDHIQNFNESCFIQQLQAFANQVLHLEEAIFHLEMNKKHLGCHFDYAHPIARVGQDDLVDSFQYYYKPEHKYEECNFVLNGRPLFCPFIEEMNPLEIKKIFINWLIGNLNEALGIENKDLTDLHTMLICNSQTNHEISQPLCELLNALFKEYDLTEKGIGKILNALPTLKCHKDFAHWANKNLHKHIVQRQFTSPQIIVDLFLKYLWYRTCRRVVPCFSILQALSCKAYSHANLQIDELSPESCNKEGLPYLHSQQQDRVRYHIEINEQMDAFKVTHEKLYSYITGDETNYTLFGTMKIFWMVKGHTKGGQFSSLLWCDELKLDPNQPFTIRYQIAQKLGLVI